MRILLTNHFPLTGSGSGVYVANVARELVGLGHQPLVLCPDTAPPAEGEAPCPVDTIICPAPGESGEGKDLSFPFPCFTTHPRSNRTFYALTDAEVAEYVAVFETRVRAAAEKHDSEVIHAQHLWICSAAAARTGRPYLVTSHGTDLLGYRAGARYRLVALPNGVDGKVFRPLEVNRAGIFRGLGLEAPIGPVVVYAGKLAVFKGPDILLDAASIYERNIPGVVTVIAGEGAERRVLEKMARGLHVRNVHFLGFLEQEVLVRLYAAADLAVVPSREEPFGLSALEAMACGLPVVASAVGGLTEYVDDSVGRLVPPDDPGELARAVTEELRSGGREAKGRRAAERGTTYTWRKHTDRLVELYAGAIEAKKK